MVLKAAVLCCEEESASKPPSAHAPYPSQGRQAVLRELLGSARWKQPPWIEPPFHINYGFNLFVGKHFYANFGCTILDETRVEIGDRVLMGPNVKVGLDEMGLGWSWAEP